MKCNEPGCQGVPMPRSIYCIFHAPKCAHVIHIVATVPPKKTTCAQLATPGNRFCSAHATAHGAGKGWINK